VAELLGDQPALGLEAQAQFLALCIH
jgi:hypothetical protein